MADLPPSYDSTIQAMITLWDEFPQDQRIEYYQESIAAYKDTDKQTEADNILSIVGDKAIRTDWSFYVSLKEFAEFAKKSQDRYPELDSEYVPRWEGLYKDWITAFQASQDYAAVTAAEYQDRYIGVILELVGSVDLNDPESVKKEKARLLRYSKEEQPAVIPVDYEIAFEKLRHDVAEFQRKYEQYLTGKGGQVNEKTDLEKELSQLVGRLDELDRAVDDWTNALAATSWAGLTGTIVNGVGLAIKTAERNATAKDVGNKRNEIHIANRAESDLAHMVTNFATLGGDFDSIKGPLKCLTQIWKDMHVSSMKISYLLERAINGGDDEKEFKLALESAKYAAEPIYSSLSQYSKKVKESYDRT